MLNNWPRGAIRSPGGPNTAAAEAAAVLAGELTKPREKAMRSSLNRLKRLDVDGCFHHTQNTVAHQQQRCINLDLDQMALNISVYIKQEFLFFQDLEILFQYELNIHPGHPIAIQCLLALKKIRKAYQAKFPVPFEKMKEIRKSVSHAIQHPYRERSTDLETFLQTNPEIVKHTVDVSCPPSVGNKRARLSTTENMNLNRVSDTCILSILRLL